MPAVSVRRTENAASRRAQHLSLPPRAAYRGTEEEALDTAQDHHLWAAIRDNQDLQQQTELEPGNPKLIQPPCR